MNIYADTDQTPIKFILALIGLSIKNAYIAY